MLRTVFFGTPDFAVPTLAAMVEAGYRPALVISQPARPIGRGRRRREPPVSAWARERGLPVRQPETVRDPAFLAALEALAPEVAVVVAFGQIFRRRLLALPRHGCLNLHASLLPAYRGAAPIQAAIARGERRTGVTTMQMAAGLDSGPILLQAGLEIGADETAPALAERLAARGAALIVETLERLAAGTLEPRPQDPAGISHAPRLEKRDGEVDWTLAADVLYNRWRAYQPWPGLTAALGGRPLKLVAVRALAGGGAAETSAAGAPGTVLGLDGDAVLVACGGGTMLALDRVQRPGRKGVAAAAWANGERLTRGAAFAPPATSDPRPKP